MNYREKIRKAIECPQFGNETYGEWGALRLEQRVLIKRLLDQLDSADNYFKKVYLENKQLKEQIEEYQKALDETQQKEFINYLEKRYKDVTSVIGSFGSNTDLLYGKKYMLEEILQKYKEITGK